MRSPEVAGLFYPSTKKECVEFIDSAGVEEKACSSVVISPHAGWIFSGKTSIHSIQALKNSGASRFLLIGPSHYFSEGAFLSGQDWKTPFGVARKDESLLKELGFEVSDYFHAKEHSIEVQIPFLQYFFKKFTFAALLLGDQSWSSCRQIASLIPDDVTLIASSDFTHYEPEAIAREKDLKALKFVNNLEAEKFNRHVENNNLSICGYGAVTIAVEIAKIRSKKPKLLDFSNSGETGRGVVNYVSFAFV